MRVEKETKPFRLVPGTTEMLEKLSLRYPLAVVSARNTLNHGILEPIQSASLFQVHRHRSDL